MKHHIPMQILHESPTEACIRLLTAAITRRNPGISPGAAKERAVSAVMSALCHREPQQDKP